MHPPRWCSTLLLLALAAGACSSSPFGLVERQELSAARARWERAAISHYRVEVKVSCFCINALPQFTLIEVHHDTVVSAEPVDPSFEIPLEGWPTVTDAFAILERADDSGTYDEVDAAYEAELGYPLHLSLSCPADILDCGYSLRFRNLEPVHPVQASWRGLEPGGPAAGPAP